MNLEDIKKDCEARLKRTMVKLDAGANEIINSSFDDFYSQGTPKRKRTHTLPGSKYVSLSGGKSSYNLEAGYEGDQISYQDGTFSGGEVLGATMTGTYGVLGNPGYDEKAFDDIIKKTDQLFSSEFSK